MNNKTNLAVTEEEAIKLLTSSFSGNNEIKVFDNYGNYFFPTDITMNTPNDACGSLNTIIIFKNCKNS